MKYGVLVVMIGVLFSTGCSSKKIYDEHGYLFNPTGVWDEFKYDNKDYDSYAEATAALRTRLKAVWHIRHALGRYTKPARDDASGIVARLVPADGPIATDKCHGGSKGIVILLHGLYDSPYTMKDIGVFFNNQCYQSRFLLLPGHGTVPGDLRELSHQQWIDAVKAVVERTIGEYQHEKLILAGFSTGAGLALNYALDNPEAVDALFLFAPLVNLPVGRVLGARVIGGLKEYIQKAEEIDSFKYESVPANSVLQANHLASEVEEKLRKGNLTIPVFITQAKNDYTLSSQATIDLFNDNAFGTKSVFLLYSPEGAAADVGADGFAFLNCDAPKDVFKNNNRVACKSNFVHSQDGSNATIDDYSHMSLTLPPDDLHYGINGKYRYCLHYRKGTNLQRCRSDKLDVCFGERAIFRGQHVSKKCPEYDSVMIRLTSNPKFEHLKNQLSYFMVRQNL